MREVILTTELLLGTVALLVVLALTFTFARRRAIARGEPLLLCAFRPGRSRPWRYGLARYGASGLDWFPLSGLSIRPKHSWERYLLDIEAASPMPPGERPATLIPAAMLLPCTYGDESFDLALSRNRYTALKSWLEASPPGRQVDVP